MPDYMYMLESRLSAEQRAVLLRMQQLAVETSTNVYLTGGAVRDVISGMPIRDLDFTVEGNPSRFARELEKGGGRVVHEDEKLRHVEMLFAGDVDGSVAAAREEIYPRPEARPETRWSTIMEDLRRRDFSLNAVAISLNAASRGLLLDPTNGLADLESREVRALSIHSFSNQPVRLLRAIRYAARMEFKLEPRTEEWFKLALERGKREAISPADAGSELRQVAREDKPVQILKAWEARDLLEPISPQLAKRHPHYEMLARILRARDDLAAAGIRPRLFAPVTFAVLGRLKDRELTSALNHLEFRAQEIETDRHGRRPGVQNYRGTGRAQDGVSGRCLRFSGEGARRSACVYSGGVLELQGRGKNSHLSHEMEAVAPGFARRRAGTRNDRHGAWPEIR